MTYHLVPSEINFIQLLDGSIPNAAVVSLTVLESEVILQVPPAEIVTITLETFLIVNSLPFPTSAAVGKVIVEAEDPVKIIYVTLVEDVYVVLALVDVTVPPALFQVAKPVASDVKTFPAPAPVVIFTVLLNVAAPVAVTAAKVVAPVTAKVFPNVVAPVTPSVPPTVSLFVTLKLVKVEVPAIKVEDNVVAPVTPNVPPTVAAPVMAALASVDAPADKVEEKVPAPVTPNVLPSVVAPVTPSVPAITVLPDAAATVNLLVFTARSPVIAALASVEAPAFKVEENVPAAAVKLPVRFNPAAEIVPLVLTFETTPFPN